MNIFYIFLFSAMPLLYKFNKIKHQMQDPIIARCNEPDSYLNNLINYEYFNSMKNYYASRLPKSSILIH
jgi:hypothetical protein